MDKVSLWNKRTNHKLKWLIEKFIKNIHSIKIEYKKQHILSYSTVMNILKYMEILYIRKQVQIYSCEMQLMVADINIIEHM